MLSRAQVLDQLRNPVRGWRTVTEYPISVVAHNEELGVSLEAFFWPSGNLNHLDTVDAQLGIRMSQSGDEVQSIPRASEAVQLAWAKEDDSASERGVYGRNT